MMGGEEVLENSDGFSGTVGLKLLDGLDWIVLRPESKQNFL
jgi:hypothetical protein